MSTTEIGLNQEVITLTTNPEQEERLDAQERARGEQLALVAAKYAVVGATIIAVLMALVKWLFFPSYPHLLILAIAIVPAIVAGLLYPRLHRKGRARLAAYVMLISTLIANTAIYFLLPQTISVLALGYMFIIIVGHLLLGYKDNRWVIVSCPLIFLVTIIVADVWQLPGRISPLPETVETVTSITLSIASVITVGLVVDAVMRMSDQAFRRAQLASWEIEKHAAIEQEQRERLQEAMEAVETANQALAESNRELQASRDVLQAQTDEIRSLNERLKEENLRMEAELDVTRQLQQMLLPTEEELHQIKGLDIAGFMDPAEEIGGDYYDVLQHNGQVKIGIGDVTGHGLESGVVMLMIQTAVRTLLTSEEQDSVRFLNVINRTLHDNIQRMDVDKSMSLTLLDCELGQGKMNASGQHEQMLIVRCGGQVEVMDTLDLGFPLGLEPEIARFVEEASIHLQPGDGIVLYSDGITEAENVESEFYGMERLCEVVSGHWAGAAEAVKDAVVADVRGFIGEQMVYDDLTLLVVKQQ